MKKLKTSRLQIAYMDKNLVAVFEIGFFVPLLIVGAMFAGKFQVNVEYINGLLTASSILFGLWGLF